MKATGGLTSSVGNQPPALPPRPNNRAYSHIVSSDEAPDTGDDSDDDMITNYLHGGADSTLVNNNNPPILEDNLSHLTHIQERIHRMRLENAAAAGVYFQPNQKSKLLPAPLLLSPSKQNRLSNSCPSLNNSIVDNDSIVDRCVNSNYTYENFPISESKRKPSRSPFKEPGSGQVGSTKITVRKRHGPKKRSVSPSSGESDADVPDGSGSSYLMKNRTKSMSIHGHNQNNQVKLCSHSPTLTAFRSKDEEVQTPSPRGADGLYTRFFQSRHLSKNDGPYLSAQFGHVLQKSISTPSIVVEQGGTSGNSTTEFPQPTHVFLQQLISDHDWMRKSQEPHDEDVSADGGSDSENGLDRTESNFHFHSENPTVGVLRSNSSNASTRGKVKRIHPIIIGPTNSTPSPQLSLAEFLQNDPTLEDDDARKRRRKKERSSLFFRKKKEKGANKVSGGFSVSGPPVIGPPVFDPSHGFDKIGASHRSNASNNGNVPGLTKVSSSINLGSGSFGSSSAKSASTNSSIQPKYSQQHSYSMSSLRRGPNPIQTPPYGSSSSNFYIAKGGEICKTHDDREDYNHDGDTVGLIEGEIIPGEDLPEGGPAAIRDLETAPFLKIQEEEAETWQQTVRPEDINGLRPVDIKHQEHIYEVIITEANHCQVLKVIEKIFVEGMYKCLNLSKDVVDRIFPSIDKMIKIHMNFLEDLRIRQNEQPVVSTIADILYKQFSGENANIWKEAYGAFCSSHNEAVGVFKDLMKSDRRFQLFVRQCSENPLLKKKGVPECILFVTTRITKYPLLIDALIKTAKDRPLDEEYLRQANMHVKEILKDVNSKVAEKERKTRLLEIYHKLDAKSTIVYRGKKFKKSDVLMANRKLMFEGVGILNQAKNRSMMVTIVILSDILLFLQENNQKYYFVTPENKPSVLPVQSLLARDKPGGTTKSMVIMSTASSKDAGSLGDLEVFDVEIQQPPTREDWIAGIRNAVDSYTPGSESEAEVADSSMTRKSLDQKHLKMRRLTASLKAKDLEMAKLLDEKMKIMRDVVQVVSEGEGNVLVNLPNTDYLKLVNSGADEGSFTKEHLLAALQEASKLAVSLNSGTLSRSASSVGERHSQDFSAPLLPKRAETFSEFDQSTVYAPSKKLVVQEINLMTGETDEAEFISRSSGTNPQLDSTVNDPPSSSQANTTLTAPNSSHTSSPLQSLDPEEQKTAYEMTHQLNRLMCMVSTHFTNMESIKAELAEIKEKSRVSGGRYVQNQQLEELRNLQEHLAKEKRAWQVEREDREKENEIKKAELQKAQEEIDRHKKDIKEQREQLFRKLEVLRKYQGIELGPNMAILKSDPSAGIISHQHVEPKFDGSGSDIPDKAVPGRQSASGGLTTPNVGVRKASSMSGGTGNHVLVHANTMATGGSLKKDSFTNQNLMSATNETKQSVVGIEKHEIRQQIPVKLSSKLSVSTRGLASQSTSALAALGSAPALTDIKSSKKSTVSNNMSTVSTSALPQVVQFTKPDGMQQLLPFKLSESQHVGLTQQQTSPGKHRQSSNTYYGEKQGVNRFQQHSLGHQDLAQQRQLRGLQSVQDQQPYQKVNSNTLPKKSPGDKVSTAGAVGSEAQSGDDVIYFF